MRKDFGAKPYTYPQPVFIVATYDEAGVADAMNAAWGGISNDTQITMCLSAGHKTVKNISGNLKKIGFFARTGQSEMEQFWRNLLSRAAISEGEAQYLEMIFDKAAGLSKHGVTQGHKTPDEHQ